MTNAIRTPPPHAGAADELSDAELEAVSGGGQKGQVVARSLPPQWGGRASRRGVAVRPAAAAVPAVSGGCTGTSCPA